MKRIFFALGAFALPALASAQSITGQSVATIGTAYNFILGLINYIIVPLIFAVAFLYFIWGVYRYFIAGGGSEEKVHEGQKFVMWSVIGFVLMFSIWGLVNVLMDTLPFGSTSMPCIPTFGSCSGTSGGSNPFDTSGTYGGTGTSGTPGGTGTSGTYGGTGTSGTSGGTGMDTQQWSI